MWPLGNQAGHPPTHHSLFTIDHSLVIGHYQTAKHRHGYGHDTFKHVFQINEIVQALCESCDNEKKLQNSS